MQQHTYDKVNKYNGHNKEEGYEQGNHRTRERQLKNKTRMIMFDSAKAAKLCMYKFC